MSAHARVGPWNDARSARPGPRRRPSRWSWPPTTARCASTQLLAGPARPDAAGRALRGDRRRRRLVGRHAGRAGPRAPATATCASACRLRVERRGPAGARNLGWRLAQGAASWPSPTTTACPRRLARDAARRGAASGGEAIVRGRTLPTPPRRTRSAVRQDRPDRRPEPVLRDLQHRLPAVAARADRRLRRVVRPGPARTPTSVRARSRRVACPRSSRTLVHHAVLARGPCGGAPRRAPAADGVRAYKRNPSLRRNLALGLFYDRSHPLLLAGPRRPASRAARWSPRCWPAVRLAPARRLRGTWRPPASRGLLRRSSTRSSSSRRCAARARPHARSLRQRAPRPFRRGPDAEWPAMEKRSSRWSSAPYEVERRAAARAARSACRPRSRRCSSGAGSRTPMRPTRFLSARERHDPRALPGLDRPRAS